MTNELDEKFSEALSKSEEEDDNIDNWYNRANIDGITEEQNKIIGKISKRQVPQNYFIEQRLGRDKLRANLIERLNDIINNENTTEEMRIEAQKKIMHIGDLSEKELRIEGLIKAKGFEEAIVFLTDENLKIIVSVEDLKEQDVVKILNIAMETI